MATKQELLDLIRSLLKSYEAYCYINEPKSPLQWDEYDCMMAPRWIEADLIIKRESK